MERRAKIIATIGPSCHTLQMLRNLILAGMDVARLNFSHGTHEEHAVNINNIRSLSKQLNKPIAILQDLQGPKLRVGNLPEAGLTLTEGQIVLLAPFEQEINPSNSDWKNEIVIPLEVPNLIGSLKPGNRILLDDGQIEFQTLDVFSHSIKAQVTISGILKSHKGVNLPGIDLGIPPLTSKDIEDLKFGLEQKVDFLAISFVHRADDITLVKKKIFEFSPSQKDIPIIAKLECPEAIDNLMEILEVADGVMVARGDLGVETSPSSVPIFQKKVIQTANLKGKIVITATQMLESMIHNPRPTRAEASDVANAIFDGTDAVMLSGETAAGAYPLESVEMMSKIVLEAEDHFQDWGKQPCPENCRLNDDATAVAQAAKAMANDRNVSYIAVFTLSGKTAAIMANLRPEVPILALTPELHTYYLMSLYWGVKPYLVPIANAVETMITHVDNVIINSTDLLPGEQVVIVSGLPVGKMRLPNFALLHTVGEDV
jgi:pyruvate kinase